MRKIFSKLRALIIGISTTASVVACGSDESKPKVENNLNTIITQTNLGEIIMAGSIPTKEELLVAIKETNPEAVDLTLDDFDLKKRLKKELKKVIIFGKGKYQGEVTLQYITIDFDMEKFFKKLVKFYFEKLKNTTITEISADNLKFNLNMEQIVTNTQINKKVLAEILIHSDVSEFKNSSDVQQQHLTPTFSQAVTNTFSVTRRVDFGLKQKFKIGFPEIIDIETEIDFTLSKSSTQTKSQTKTITSSAQRINVPPHKQIDIITELYKTKQIYQYVLVAKLNKNATFSFKNIKFTEEWEGKDGKYTGTTTPFDQEFKLYDILDYLAINNSSDNNLIYVNNNNLYSETLLVVNTETNEFKVTDREKPYL